MTLQLMSADRIPPHAEVLVAALNRSAVFQFSHLRPPPRSISNNAYYESAKETDTFGQERTATISPYLGHSNEKLQHKLGRTNPRLQGSFTDCPVTPRKDVGRKNAVVLRRKNDGDGTAKISVIKECLQKFIKRQREIRRRYRSRQGGERDEIEEDERLEVSRRVRKDLKLIISTRINKGGDAS